MLGGLFAALRPALAILVFGGAAVVLVAPAVDMAAQRAESRAATSGAAPLRNHPDATPKPDEDPNEDFRAKIVAKLEPEPTKKPEPKQETTKKPEPVVAVKKVEPAKTSFDTLLQKCLDTRDENSDACIRAGEASGLSADDWAAKIRGKLDAARQSDFATYFEKCLGTRDLGSDHCLRAEELSGLSREDFDAKFDAKLAAKDGGDFWTVFEKCLDTRNVNSDTCFRAQELIGFNDADFHSKFERTWPTATPRPRRRRQRRSPRRGHS
jgi:hypothetical protein